MIQLVSDETGFLHLDPEYELNQSVNIEKMLAQASEVAQASEET